MSESVFTCPVCGLRLDRGERAYVCSRGHLYDVAADGYVNLLLSNRKHSENPGDDKGMMRARHELLERGYFRVLRDELARLCLRHVPESGGVAVDSGCGEGYYTAGVWEAGGGALRVGGVDVSKYGVRLGAKRGTGAEFCVGSAYCLPLGEGTVDVLWSCFSPVALDEFRRVLRAGGVLVLVQPSAGHLWGFKNVLYDSPYENPPNHYEHDGFEAVDRYEIGDTVQIRGNADVLNLFRMTPYYWKTSVADGEKLKAVDSLETEVGFILDVLRAK